MSEKKRDALTQVIIDRWPLIFGNVDPSWNTILSSNELKNHFYNALRASYAMFKTSGGTTALFDSLPLEQQIQHLSTSIDRYILPAVSNMMMPFILTSLSRLKVVIIGQDPYPDSSKARGLAFSTGNPSVDPISIPQSLDAIYKSLHKYGHISQMPDHGCLFNWAAQGVLMLNVTPLYISKECQKPLKEHWLPFTRGFIKLLASQGSSNIVWVLFGNEAQALHSMIISATQGPSALPTVTATLTPTVKVYTFRHPSPQANNMLAEDMKFSNVDHFGTINKMLAVASQPPINWSVTSDTEIYCDGSVLGVEDRRAGYAFVYGAGPHRGLIVYQAITSQEQQPDQLTSNRAEVMAIIKALESSLIKQTTGQLKVITDSTYACNMASSYVYSWDDNKAQSQKNYDLFVVLKSLIQRVNKAYVKYGGVLFYQMPRKSNSALVLADDYAKAAAQSPDTAQKYIYMNF
jgi:uracil-DNA glycosylase